MTRAPSRVLDPSDYYDGLPGTLWKPANLPRLPSNAPAELKIHTVDIDDDPKKVYVLYRAQRRHGFQDLVQRFENQLVYGCQATFCDTPTCFTCARRVAGKAPIRRFHDTSARTLACYLASQDNPESSLCRNPSAAPWERSASYKTNPSKSKMVRRDLLSPTYTSSPVRKQSDKKSLDHEVTELETSDSQLLLQRDKRRLGRDEQTNILVAERIDQLREPKKKDSKSFIQSLYGTVSLKMLDWLSPQSLYALSSPETTSKSWRDEKNDASVVDSQPVANMSPPNVDAQRTTNLSGVEPKSSASVQSDKLLPSRQESRRSLEKSAWSPTLNGNGKTEKHTPEAATESQPPLLPSKSGAIIVPNHPTASNGQAEPSDSDVLSKLPQDKPIKPSLSRRRSVKKSHRLSACRQVTSIVDLNADIEPHETYFVKDDEVNLDQQSGETVKLDDANGPGSVKEPRPALENENRAIENRNFKPQTISLMTPEIVEVFCNFMQNHGLCETHDLFPTTIEPNLRRFRRDVPPIQIPARTGDRDLRTDISSKMEWKKFIEQSFFYVLSSPDELLRSFTIRQGSLMDSLSMWYIMVRLTRVSPTLVFDSLWTSSTRLFGAPKELQSKHCWIAKSTTSTDAEAFGPCQSDEAAHLVLVCLHALAAAMPLRWENKLGAKASSWSRIFNGERRAIARELSPGVYRRRLRYHDAFTNESALRLARRVFRGIASVLRYEELTSIERGEHTTERRGQCAFFDVVLGYIESCQSAAEFPAENFLDFSHEYNDPEPNVPTSTFHDLSKQMVEWARTVILQEWKGEAEVSKDGVFGGALAFMSAMYRNQERVVLNDSDFVVEHFAGRLSSMEVPVEWLSFTPNRKTLHLLDHPYLFKASSLVDYFRSINLHRMRKAYETAINFGSRTSMATAPGRLMTDSNHRQHLLDRLRTALSKYLVLEIRRDKVLQDAFDQLWRRELRELLRPFKVRLGESLGEEGFDLGGVQQEFFRLAIAEALDPNYGTFSVDERTKMTWFVPSSLTPLWRCELIGLIVSLAVYNGLTLPVTFPQAMYRKLLGIENTEIEHIEDGWPDLAKGLTTLLEWDEEKDGSVADVFARTYEFSVESFGEQISRDMSALSSWPQFGLTATTNPTEAPLVDGSNRKAYVNDYIRWLTDISIRPQFEAFKSGFYTCLDRRSLSLFEPHILQTVVEGVQEIDISELRRNTRYVGWSASNRTVRDFWSIVKRYDMERKKKLLEFVTASDRVPVGGMQGLHFVLQKNGTGDSKRLPTSYTCFATLLLPEYENKEVLGEKLEIAINNAKGFGFA